MNRFFALALLLCCCSSTLQDSRPVSWSRADFIFPYALESPLQSWTLPDILREISGIALDASEDHFLAVQDELGEVFSVDVDSGTIVGQVSFWKDGDYEDLEYIADTVYVLKSNGNLYRIHPFSQPPRNMDKLETPLNGDYDAEGLAWDPVNNRLLMACKGKSMDGPEGTLKKAVYAFDLASGNLIPDPVFLISLDSVHAFLQSTPTLRKWESLLEEFQPHHTEFAFNPSAIARHPLTGDYYLTSTAGKKLLLVLSPEGSILHMEKLSGKLHDQPEGLCFDREGNLYLSNEGKSGPGIIYKFAAIR